MALESIMEALTRFESAKRDDLKNYRDVDALLRSNPLIAALVTHIEVGVCSRVIAELEKLLPKRLDLELLGYEQVAEIMHKSVPAVRQMKARGYIQAAKFTQHGKTYFTRESVQAAIADAEQREKSIRERRKKNMNQVKNQRTAA